MMQLTTLETYGMFCTVSLAMNFLLFIAKNRSNKREKITKKVAEEIEKVNYNLKEKNYKLKRLGKSYKNKVEKIEKILSKKKISGEMPTSIKNKVSLDDIEKWNNSNCVDRYIWLHNLKETTDELVN